MSNNVYKERSAPVVAVASQRWMPESYKIEYDGVTFPKITHVAATGVTPEHGTYEGPEGTVVVSRGDVITVGAAGNYASYTWLAFNSAYESV